MSNYSIYKYYKGEKENPFTGKDRIAAMWWDGEKSFHSSTREPEFFGTVKRLLKDAIDTNDVRGVLIDETVDMDKRVLIFYLDLWHSKWFPYDDLDLILKY